MQALVQIELDIEHLALRNQIKQGLASCTEEQVGIFKRMYSHKDLEKPIDQVVDDMFIPQLKHALRQVETTVASNGEKEAAALSEIDR